MKKRLVALFLSLILLPLGLSLGLGWRSVQDAQTSALVQARALWTGPVTDLRDQAAAFVRRTEEDLRAGRGGPGLVLTAFRLRGGTVVEPPRYRADGTAEPFFTRTADLWDQRFWDRAAGEGQAVPDAGWKVWNRGNGTGYLYWLREGQAVRGYELDSAAFLARLSAALPDLGWGSVEGQGRSLVLRDGAGGTFARWGRWDAGESPALLTLPLSGPFATWELRLTLSPQALGGAGTLWVWLFALVGLGLAGTVGLGSWVFVRTWRASLVEAGQRVNFVNQVSHELKTPLTNILLYGELLEASLGPGLDARARGYLEVLRGESGRLGRLITNVLTFARRDRPDQPHPRPLVWDTAVEAALKPFRPGLADRGLSLDWRPGAPGVTGAWDQDWLDQMLGNLVSNAEKYAAAGAWVGVSTGAGGTEVWVRVADRGPGIPAAAAERVFQPFARLDNRLHAGAAGTGLGLGIARDLARRHGGDLVLEAPDPGAPGASFVLRLPRQSGPA